MIKHEPYLYGYYFNSSYESSDIFLNEALNAKHPECLDEFSDKLPDCENAHFQNSQIVELNGQLPNQPSTKRIESIRPLFNDVIAETECYLTKEDCNYFSISWKAFFFYLNVKHKLIRYKLSKKRESLNKVKHDVHLLSAISPQVEKYWKDFIEFSQYEENVLERLKTEQLKYNLERVEENRIKRLLKLYSKRCWEMHWNNNVPSQKVIESSLATSNNLNTNVNHVNM